MRVHQSPRPLDLRRLLILLGIMICFVPPALHAAPDDHLPTRPRLKGDGQKWRIGYLQGGGYASYQHSLASIARGLMRIGWIVEAELPIPQDEKDSEVLWRWLATEASSDYLEFAADAFYDGAWDDARLPVMKKELLDRLTGPRDIDLMLAMGTKAGQFLATSDHSVPTIVGSTTDPIAGGIIMSAEDSGLDHIHAKVDPDRHRMQVRLFHDIFNFGTLGIVYEESKEGRGFAAIDNVYEVAAEREFKVEKCEAPYNGLGRQEAEAKVLECYSALAGKVEAVYIVRHPGVNLTTLAAILEPLVDRKIPTFAQGLSDEVRHGVLLSISLADFSYIGDFYAMTIGKILNGAKPRNLTQIFQNPPKIAINLKTAQRIGYDPSVDIVGAADEIFTEVADPPSKP